MHPPFSHEKEKLLSSVCSLGIGGPARFFAQAFSKEELLTMLYWCRSNAVPFFILGKGSNCLFDDRGYSGLVIQNRIEYLEQEGHQFVVGAGFSFTRLGSLTAREGWAGLEFASGIPGTVGGAIYMNAGANGKQTADTLIKVTYLTDQGDCIEFKKEELTFSYRFSPFQKKVGTILEGVFQLEKCEQANHKQKEILGYRLKTQPYKDKSAGCAFRNPLNTAAGRLIEECGLKGVQIGGAKISELHGNFIINAGNAKARDYLDLLKHVKEKIYGAKGILLEEEVCYIPYDGNFL